MKVFKFGGASIKDVAGVENVAAILQKTGVTQKVVVVSAMGKMTNALEAVIDAYFDEPEAVKSKLDFVCDFHLKICEGLFDSTHQIHRKIEDYTIELDTFLKQNKSTNYNYVYDQVVAYGELMSTTIVSEYLLTRQIDNTWLDARELIKTDMVFRDAKVDWRASEERITRLVSRDSLSITQGFIASEKNKWTTTLGREGSDYTAGIMAYCLDAESVSIWKNVAGVLNADPREFSEVSLLEHISYQEAIELAFYGASVIHPKTLQPLQRKEIPLFVKSFYHPDRAGTSVSKGVEIFPEIPCFIVKKNLVLLSLSTLDFSFFMEENVSEVFALFHKFQSKVRLIQNSAISFSVCVEDKFGHADQLIARLQENFKVSYNKKVNLYTIRHFDKASIDKIRGNKSVLLEQLTRGTVQLVTKG